MRKGLILVLLIFTQSLVAQNSQLSSPVRVQREPIESSGKRKKLKSKVREQKFEKRRAELIEKRREPTKSKWGFLADYRAATDLQDQTTPRVVAHAVAAGVRYRLLEDLYVSGAISANYDSSGSNSSEVLVADRDTEAYMGDVTLGVSGREQDISWEVDNEFPTSPYSRSEGYNSITNLETSWRFQFFERLFYIAPTLSGHYVWNKYEKSPNTGATNKMAGVRAGLLLGVKVWQGLFCRLVVGVQSTRFTDGSSDTAARNSVGIGYGWDHLTVALDFSNGTYADREETHLWFMDQYRRIISLRATASF